jgi:hypothetical protein
LPADDVRELEAIARARENLRVLEGLLENAKADAAAAAAAGGTAAAAAAAAGGTAAAGAAAGRAATAEAPPFATAAGSWAAMPRGGGGGGGGGDNASIIIGTEAIERGGGGGGPGANVARGDAGESATPATAVSRRGLLVELYHTEHAAAAEARSGVGAVDHVRDTNRKRVWEEAHGGGEAAAGGGGGGGGGAATTRQATSDARSAGESQGAVTVALSAAAARTPSELKRDTDAARVLLIDVLYNALERACGTFDECVCSVCKKLLSGAHALSCGHAFCLECIPVPVEGMAATCPSCKTPVRAAPHVALLVGVIMWTSHLIDKRRRPPAHVLFVLSAH